MRTDAGSAAASGPDGEFGGRAAWVTGAAQGIGRRVAERLASEGAQVACFDRNAIRVEQTAQSIRKGGGRAAEFVADVSDWVQMERAAAEAVAVHGPAQLVVVNAAIAGPFATVDQLEPSDWADVVAVNLNGSFHTLRAALPQMLRHAGGSVVFIASVAGLRGYTRTAPYVASKHGVIGLMRSVANEVSSMGIRVNAVCPGLVDTPMIDDELETLGLDRERARTAGVEEHLIERMISPDEIADAVIWLLSSRAGMVTGAAIPVDGGSLAKTYPRY